MNIKIYLAKKDCNNNNFYINIQFVDIFLKNEFILFILKLNFE